MPMPDMTAPALSGQQDALRFRSVFGGRRRLYHQGDRLSHGEREEGLATGGAALSWEWTAFSARSNSS